MRAEFLYTCNSCGKKDRIGNLKGAVVDKIKKSVGNLCHECFDRIHGTKPEKKINLRCFCCGKTTREWSEMDGYPYCRECAPI